MSALDDLVQGIRDLYARFSACTFAVYRGDVLVASFGSPGAPPSYHRGALVGRELHVTPTARGAALALELPEEVVVVAEVNDPRWVGVTGVELMRLARLGPQ